MLSVAAVAGTLLVAAAAPSGAPPKDELLVLGIRTARGGLSTYLVDSSGIKKAGDAIAVPRKDGWWRLTRIVRDKGETTETFYWASPLAASRPPPPLSDDEECTHQLEQTLLFVGSDYVAIEESNSGYCEGAAHPWGSVGLETDDITQTLDASGVEIEKALGKPASAALLKAGEVAGGGATKREEDCLAGPSTTAWALIRSGGRWVVRGAIGYAAEACRGNHLYYTVDVRPPAAFTGVSDPAQPFKDLTAKCPGAVDVVPSPSGRFLLAVTKQGLDLYVDGKRAAQVADAGTAIVMTQWALGAAAERWRSEAVKAASAATDW